MGTRVRLFKRGKKQPEPADRNDNKPRHFRRLLKNSFHHYSALFPGRFSWLSNLVFRFLFRGVTLEDEDRRELKKAAEKGAIVYVTRSRSRLEYLLLSFKLREEGLPFPQFCHYLSVYLWQSWLTFVRRTVGIAVSFFERQGYPNPYRNGFVRLLLAEKVPMLLPLHHFRGLPWRFSRQHLDPLQELIQIRRDTTRPIMIVPLVLIYGRRPDRDTRSVLDMLVGPADNPGRVRRIVMFVRNIRSIYLKVAEVAELDELEASASLRVPMMADRLPETAYHIRQACLERIEAERRVVLGPARKSRAEIIEMILHDRNFVSALLKYCKENDEPFIDTRRRARRYLEEMVAEIRPTVISFLRWLMDRLLPRVYDSIEVDAKGLEKVRRIARRMPVVFMPSHKSHIDYILLNYILYNNHISLPVTVSGINLNFWPIGNLFRGAGAFFIRRSFRGKRIYTLCFVKYIEALLREGVGLTFYVEGGRSRIGKLLPPKLGFVQHLLNASIGSGRRELAFVPVSIGYERIFEERFYTNEAAGKPNEGETLGTILKNRRMLTKKRGRVWLDFADPIPLQEMLWDAQITTVPRDDDGRRELARQIVHRAAYALNELHPVTPYAVTAEALLAGTRRGVSGRMVVERFRLLTDYLRSRQVKLPGFGSHPRTTVYNILPVMVAEKLLTMEESPEDDDEPFYFLDESKRLALTIYANTVVPQHPYISLLSLGLLAADKAQSAGELFIEFRYLLRRLARECVLGKTPARAVDEERRNFVRVLVHFRQRGWLSEIDEGLELSPHGRFAAETFGAVIAGYLESYHLAARALLKRKAEVFTTKEIIDAAIKKGTRLVAIGELSHPEAVHQLMLQNAMRLYEDWGIMRAELVVGDKTKTAGRNYQVADFVQLRDIVERTQIYLPK